MQLIKVAYQLIPDNEWAISLIMSKRHDRKRNYVVPLSTIML